MLPPIYAYMLVRAHPHHSHNLLCDAFSSGAGPRIPTATAPKLKGSQAIRKGSPSLVPGGVPPGDLIDCPYCGKTFKRRGLQQHIDFAREAGCSKHTTVASCHVRLNKQWRRMEECTDSFDRCRECGWEKAGCKCH